MVDEKRDPEQPDNEENTDETADEPLNQDDLDVDAALAAVASLSELAADDRPEDADEGEAAEEPEDSAAPADAAAETEPAAEPPAGEEDSTADEALQAPESDHADEGTDDSPQPVPAPPANEPANPVMPLAPASEIEEFTRTAADEEAEAADDTTRGTEMERGPERYQPVTAPRIPPTRIQRGQAASVIPALLLIGVGSWLLFTMTTSDTPLDPGTVAAMLVGGTGLILLARWLTSRQWAIGSFFLSVLVLLSGGVILLLTRTEVTGLAEGYPLFLIALGVTFILTALLTPVLGRRLLLVGSMAVAAGGAALLVTERILDVSLLNRISDWWQVLLAFVILVLIAPIFRRTG